MTAHGAYTKAHKAIGDVRGYALEISKCVEALTAAYPFPADPAFIESLDQIAESLKVLTPELSRIKDRSFKVSRAYLEANAGRITRELTIDIGCEKIRMVKRST
jgi:hypothetical protein